MTVSVTIDVPEHVERVVVQTQSLTPDGWKNDNPVAYGPGKHFVHIWDTKRISCVAEPSPGEELPPGTFVVG
ncbi:hypothetical protein [Bradyrhizobium erythrophlei]|uniref:Uncharacterized protein n=1 Tax=Bradyrhizobium erythrophlei TaxID=1437360 RepID=A0A1M5NLF3_9BRAD|nr:hypothetical protein [Bradyrhizobium erythrophlei]SHG90297.1 hypothetical protein SAMN05443248_3039 [Bradyrhizobium erythrophlei]